VTVKTEFQKKIGLIVIGFGVAMFCFSCATAPPRQEEPAPAPRVESSPVEKETPPATPKPAPVRPKETQTGPQKSAPAVQKHPPPAMKETKPQPTFYMHKVKYSGETLSIIALWYTGSHGNWKEIAQANPDMNPSRIFPGSEILIPDGLLKTHDPLTKEFVDRVNARTKKEKPKADTQVQPVQTQQEEPKLFGPKKTTPK
jgi:hypothetical protein